MKVPKILHGRITEKQWQGNSLDLGWSHINIIILICVYITGTSACCVTAPISYKSLTFGLWMDFPLTVSTYATTETFAFSESGSWMDVYHSQVDDQLIYGVICLNNKYVCYHFTNTTCTKTEFRKYVKCYPSQEFPYHSSILLTDGEQLDLFGYTNDAVAKLDIIKTDGCIPVTSQYSTPTKRLSPYSQVYHDLNLTEPPASLFQIPSQCAA